jgi:hypothetical protein
MEQVDGQRPGMPRWVKAMLLVAAVLALAVAAVMALSGGEHGPGRHAGDAGPTVAGVRPTGTGG